MDLLSTYQINLLSILRRYFSPSITPIYLPGSLKKINVNPGIGTAKSSVECINIAREIGIRIGRKVTLNSIESKNFPLAEYAVFLTEAYNFLQEVLSEIDLAKVTLQNSQNISPLEFNEYEDDNYFHHLRKANQDAKQITNNDLGDVIILNSLVDKQIARGFSDFDLLIILSRKTILNVNELLKMRTLIIPLIRRTYLFNVLHHHNPFFWTSIDLKYFPESLLPLEVLFYSRVLGTDYPVKRTFHIRNSLQSIQDRFLKRVKRFTMTSEYQLEDVWQIMRQISSFFLLFPLYSQLSGEGIYKGNAFEKVKKDHPDLDWELYEKLSFIRQNIFPLFYKRMYFFRPLIYYHPHLSARVIKYIKYQPIELQKAFTVELIHRMASFAHALRHKAINRGLITIDTV